MNMIRDVIDPGGRLLARRLDQLCSTLESLTVRLRATVANVIGDSINSFVRDAAMGVLDSVAQCLSDRSPTPPPMQARNHEVYEQDDDGSYWYDDDDDDDEQALSGSAPQDQLAPAQPDRLPSALSAGLQVASFWLRRWAGRSRVLTTCAVGMAGTVFAFLGGPLAIALLDLAASASQFNDLPEAINKGASAMGLYDHR
jgi:hypothetical protein